MLGLNKVFQQSMLYFAGNIIRRVMGFLMIPLYTRFLTPADYGVIELVELFISISAITFGILATSDAMIRSYHDEQTPERRNAVISTAIWMVGGLSVVLSMVGLVFAGPLSAVLFGDRSQVELLQMALVAMVFTNLTEIALVYQRLMHRASFFVAFSIGQMVIGIALNVYFIAYAGMGANGFVISKLIYAAIGLGVLMPIVVREVRARFSLAVARSIASFGAPLILTSASFFIIHFADRFFLRPMAGLGEVGIYALAYRFAFLVTYVVGEPFGSVWNVSLYARTAAPGWRQEFSRVARYLMLCLFLAGIGLTLFIDEVLALVDSSYARAALVVPVLAFAYVMREIGDFFRGILFINKRVAVFSRITVACAILNLALNFALIGRFGAVGAAWATLLTWASYMGICWFTAQREHAIPQLAGPFAGLAGISVILWAAAPLTRSLPLWSQWVADAGLFCAALALLWLVGYISEGEARQMREYVTVRTTGLFAWAQRLRWS